MMTAKSQQRLGNALLLMFVAGVGGLWLQAPVKALFEEHLLANVGFGEAGFSDSFGALPELVKDNGGAQPVPIEASAPQRIAQYRDKAWLMAQSATAYTLQVGVFSDERRIGDLLSGRGDKDEFHYVVLPSQTNVADGTSTGPRFVLTYGQFGSRLQAEEIAAALQGLPSSLPRAWANLQNEAEAAFAAQAAADAAAPSALDGGPLMVPDADAAALPQPDAAPPSGVIPVMPKASSAPGTIPVDTL
ncbi:MAG: hypothetical protein V4730_03300 [Pseudomonadota bacterium]